MSLIEVKGLNKFYAGFELSDISFEIPAGYILGYVGQNGAGKTTTLNSIMNLTTPDSGQIRIDGITFDESNIDMYIVNRNAIYRNKCFSYHKDKKSIYQTNEQIKKLYNMSFYDKNGNREAFRAENVISLEALCKMIEE